MRKLVLLWTIFILGIPVYGQEEEQEPETSVQDETKKSEPEERESQAVRSFLDAVARNGRNRFGFSLGASEGRISNVYPDFFHSHPSNLTAFSSSVFANFGRRKSRLHFDYGAGYRIYNQQRNMNGADHHGNVSYTYQASRKIRFQLSDTASSSLNDPFSSSGLTLGTTIDWTPSPSYVVLFQPQRLTQNQARGQIDFNLTRTTNLNIFSSYDSYRYGKETFGNINTVQVGAGLGQRITKWMLISTTYSTYLNNIDGRFQDYRIHRLELGSFRFMLSRTVEVFASGGVEVADSRGERRREYRTEGMFRGGISRFSQKNVIYADYQRTMTSALGFSRILHSDVVTLGLGQRFTPRTSFRLSASYLRSADFDYAGLLEGYSGSAQLEHALHSDLFASINYAYQHQKNTIIALSGIPYFDRSIVFASLQFVWPSMRLLGE
jgi:hypothetical protein